MLHQFVIPLITLVFFNLPLYLNKNCKAIMQGFSRRGLRIKPHSLELLVLIPSRKVEFRNQTLHLRGSGVKPCGIVGYKMEETKAKAPCTNFTEENHNCELSLCKLDKSQTFPLSSSGCAKLATTLIRCKCQPAASHSMSALTSESSYPLTYRDAASSN